MPLRITAASVRTCVTGCMHRISTKCHPWSTDRVDRKAVIGIIGTILGVLVGILFSQNIQSIQKFIENIFQIDLFSDEIYYLSSLPSRLDFVEVLLVIVVSLIISLISTLLPAYRASKIDPIKTIKNE